MIITVCAMIGLLAFHKENIYNSVESFRTKKQINIILYKMIEIIQNTVSSDSVYKMKHAADTLKKTEPAELVDILSETIINNNYEDLPNYYSSDVYFLAKKFLPVVATGILGDYILIVYGKSNYSLPIKACTDNLLRLGDFGYNATVFVQHTFYDGMKQIESGIASLPRFFDYANITCKVPFSENLRGYIENIYDEGIKLLNNNEVNNMNIKIPKIEDLKNGYCFALGTAGNAVKLTSYLLYAYPNLILHNIVLDYIVPDKVNELIANSAPARYLNSYIPNPVHILNTQILSFVPENLKLKESFSGIIGFAYTLYYISNNIKEMHESTKKIAYEWEKMLESPLSFGMCHNPDGLLDDIF